jgi:hypothetical protein
MNASGFTIEEIVDTLQGMVAGLYSGGLKQEDIRPLVDSNLRDYVNNGWLSPDDAGFVFNKLGMCSAPPLPGVAGLGPFEKIAF